MYKNELYEWFWITTDLGKNYEITVHKTGSKVVRGSMTRQLVYLEKLDASSLAIHKE